jgi:hypothetical protein
MFGPRIMFLGETCRRLKLGDKLVYKGLPSTFFPVLQSDLDYWHNHKALYRERHSENDFREAQKSVDYVQEFLGEYREFSERN